VTAKPFLERWMQEQIGLPALQRRLIAEAPYIVAALPELPRLLHQRLLAPSAAAVSDAAELVSAQKSRNRWLAAIAALLVIVIVLLVRQHG